VTDRLRQSSSPDPKLGVGLESVVEPSPHPTPARYSEWLALPARSYLQQVDGSRGVELVAALAGAASSLTVLAIDGTTFRLDEGQRIATEGQ
jgi:hypothetical protein